MINNKPVNEDTYCLVEVKQCKEGLHLNEPGFFAAKGGAYVKGDDYRKFPDNIHYNTLES